MQTLPAIRRVSAVAPSSIGIETFSRPARTFTGDFYFMHRDADRLWFALGDVAGKGLPAAVVMAMIQEELEEQLTVCATRAGSPAHTLDRLHAFLLGVLPKNRFATAVIGSLDRNGTLTIANAGHCPPLLVRSDGRVEQIASTGPALGILRSAAWQTITTTLGETESMLLYSDGVIEASRNEEEVGVDGLISLVRTIGASPASISAALELTADDVTLVAIRRNPGADECETVVM